MGDEERRIVTFYTIVKKLLLEEIQSLHWFILVSITNKVELSSLRKVIQFLYCSLFGLIFSKPIYVSTFLRLQEIKTFCDVFNKNCKYLYGLPKRIYDFGFRFFYEVGEKYIISS